MIAKTMSDGLHEKLADDGELAIVDIRGPSPYTPGHIPEPENLPTATLNPEVLDREWPAEMVVSRYVGRGSEQVASALDSNVDADVSSLRGGFDAWGGAVEDGTRSENETGLGSTSPF